MSDSRGVPTGAEGEDLRAILKQVLMDPSVGHLDDDLQDRVAAACEGTGVMEAVLSREELLRRLGQLSAIQAVLVSDFAPDGQGDVTGPHLAEQEVWDALHHLAGGQADG